MKKLILSLALILASVAGAQAQQQAGFPKPGSWKANDKIQKGENLINQRNSEAFAQGMALYKEAEGILNDEITKATTEQKSDKLALLYLQRAQLMGRVLQPELESASSGMPFDTIAFCNIVDNIIGDYNASEENNNKPNAKGKVKADPTVKLHNKVGIMGMLTLYYNCGAFMDAMGKKQESVNYFQKYVDLPKVSPVFTEAERDSIYHANAKIYGTARFNLALQNFYLKNWDKAVACCDEALKDTIGVHDLYLIKINAYGEKKDSAAWERTLIEAAQRTGSSSYLQNLMYNYLQNNKIDQATAMAARLVVEKPDDKMSWFMKGAIELNIRKEYEEARKSFGKALAIDPDFQDALFNMGIAYINDIYDQTNSGKFKYVGTERKITGKNQAAYNREKAIYDQELATVKSYYEKARPYMEHLRELAPNDAKRWASPLQMIYSGLGLSDEAKEMDLLLEEANQNK